MGSFSGVSGFSVSSFSASAFSIATNADTYRPYYFNANYTQANFFTPSSTGGPVVVSGPRLRGFIPGRMPGFNSGLIF